MTEEPDLFIWRQYQKLVARFQTSQNNDLNESCQLKSPRTTTSIYTKPTYGTSSSKGNFPLYPLNNKTLSQHTGKTPDVSANTVKDICGTRPLAKATSGQEQKGAACDGALLLSEKDLTQKHLGCHCGSDWCWECTNTPFQSSCLATAQQKLQLLQTAPFLCTPSISTHLLAGFFMELSATPGTPIVIVQLMGPSLICKSSTTHIRSQVCHALSSQASKPK